MRPFDAAILARANRRAILEERRSPLNAGHGLSSRAANDASKAASWLVIVPSALIVSGGRLVDVAANSVVSPSWSAEDGLEVRFRIESDAAPVPIAPGVQVLPA